MARDCCRSRAASPPSATPAPTSRTPTRGSRRCSRARWAATAARVSSSPVTPLPWCSCAFAGRCRPAVACHAWAVPEAVR
eukprot:1608972-Rhodomonas_salina.3